MNDNTGLQAVNQTKRICLTVYVYAEVPGECDEEDLTVEFGNVKIIDGSIHRAVGEYETHETACVEETTNDSDD